MSWLFVSTQEESMDVLYQELIREMLKHWPIVAIVVGVLVSLLSIPITLVTRYYLEKKLQNRDPYVALLVGQMSDLKVDLAKWQERAIASSEGEVRGLREDLARVEDALNASHEREAGLVREKSELEKLLAAHKPYGMFFLPKTVGPGRVSTEGSILGRDIDGSLVRYTGFARIKVDEYMPATGVYESIFSELVKRRKETLAVQRF